MKDLVDIHVVLATVDDMQDHHDDPEYATDAFNQLMHMLYDAIPDDYSVEDIERCLHYCWMTWARTETLCDLDEEDFQEAVAQLLFNWKDEEYTQDYD